MITETERDSALTFMKTKAAEYAQAKADRRYLEEFRKTIKARLYHDAPGSTVADRENWAYAHADYETNLIGIKAAVEIEEKLKWQLEAAKILTEQYRTEHADNRRMDRAVQ